MSQKTKFDQVANQIMRGFNFKRSLEAQEGFRKQYCPLIKWIVSNLPKGMSAGVGGAVGKCFLWYEEDRIKVLEFLQKLKKGDFKGPGDPAHVFWLYWSRNNARGNTEKFYKKAITAIRFHIKEKELNYHVDSAEEDVFEWDKKYSFMISVNKNQYGSAYEVKAAPSTEEINKIIQSNLQPYESKCNF